MNTVFRKLIAAVVIVLTGLVSGCATQVDQVASGQALAGAGSSASVVFGKFRLVRNGEEAMINDGILGTSVVLHLENLATKDEIRGSVGDNGEFAWALEPGFYRVSKVTFNNRGERVEPLTNLTFSMSPDKEAVYIGTVTMETTIESGYYGINGTVDAYRVRNDCATDCASRLAEMGMTDAEVDIGLLRQQAPLASRR